MASVVYTKEQGCLSSRADAKHDFHTIFKSDEIQKYVTQNIPSSYTGCAIVDEDKFIDLQIMKQGVESVGNNKAKETYISENLSENISSRYEVRYVSREQHDFSKKESLIQQALNDMGVSDDVFIVCDVAYANVREDLKFANSSNSQTFYWVQNAQTLYDPAGKTSWHTDDPKYKEGSREEMYPNYFRKDGNNRFLFCWEDPTKSRVNYYPNWNNRRNQERYEFSEEIPENMIFTNKDLYLGIKTDNKTDYTKHEAVLIITDPTKPKYFAYADKDLAAKGSGILNKSELVSYRAKGNDLKRFVKFIKDTSTTNTNLKLDEVMDYSPETQVLAKKLGDASQSLSCCNKKLHLMRFIRQSAGNKIANNIEEFDSNGYHAFCSFDRIAYVCALNYNCPIVIANTQKGFTIFVRKDLTDISKQIDKTLSINIDGIELESMTRNLKALDDLSKEADTRSIISINRDLLSINFDNEENDNDFYYHRFLLTFFASIPILNLMLSVDDDPLNGTFNPNNEIIKLNKIIHEYGSQIEIPFDIKSYSTIEQLISDIKGWIISCIDSVKIAYGNINKEFETKSAASKTTKGKKDQEKKELEKREILKTLIPNCKMIDMVIYEIIQLSKKYEISVATISKLKEMHKSYAEANSDTTVTKLAKIVPKGIFTNITNCHPFSSAVTSMKIPRNSDIFLERTTQLFGITTVILPIYNSLKSDRFCNVCNHFIRQIKSVINKTKNISDKAKNLSFEIIIKIAGEQLESNEITEIECSEKTTELPLPPVPAKSAQPTPPPAPTTPVLAKEESHHLLTEDDETTDVLLNRMKLLVKPGIVCNDNIHEIITALRHVDIDKCKETIKTYTGEETSVGDLKALIKKSYDIDIFLRGFIGIMLFIESIKISKNDSFKIPVLLRSNSSSLNEKNVFKRLYELSYKNVDDGNYDDESVIRSLINLKSDIMAKLKITEDNGFNTFIEIFKRKSERENINKLRDRKYLGSAPFEQRRAFCRYINFYIQMDSFIDENTDIDDMDNKPTVTRAKNKWLSLWGDKPDFTVMSFRKLLELNTVTFNSTDNDGNDLGNLTGKFAKYRRDQFNVNMILYYYLENEIQKRNGEPIIHQGLDDLFKQLLLGSGILAPQTGGGMNGGNRNEFLKPLTELLIDMPDSDFKKFRRNLYFILHLPTKYEIEIENYHHFPDEIKVILLSDSKNILDGKKTNQLMPKMSTGGPQNNGLSKNPFNDRVQIGVRGGKRKTIKKNYRKTHKIKNKQFRSTTNKNRLKILF